MIHTDAHGHPLSGASAQAASLYDQALRQFQCYSGDPVATLQQAVADSPRFVMGHAMLAWLFLTASEAGPAGLAATTLKAAEGLSATPREQAHLRAATAWAEGRWRLAARGLEDISIAHPRDALALQVGHLLDFFTGDARMLRDRISRALPAWSAEQPGYHAILGMHAFGLEECGQYAQAEFVGHRALELDRRDGWAWHAVAHVMEMQDRVDEGIAWLHEDSEAWSKDSFFAVHNWWHLALYHLERDEIPEVLALFDGPIFGHKPATAMELVDASAMLWRLQLRGVDVGDRWRAVAEAWAPLARDGWYAFNDVHAAMAFVFAGRRDLLAEVREAQRRASSGAGDNALFTAEVGAPLLESLVALAEGDHRQAARGLRWVRPVAHRFGGSHAQRDLIDLSLIEAAIRSGDRGLAEGLVGERAATKPERASTAAMLRRALAASPVAQAA
ncbi:tetratricopeptide repeat protein [Arenimonas daejeonensis]|uniref:tetratricopeptide repeat protein n=1 Tax=Arenimonas daejeonensis TaxID=370777 RepID=UPI0011BF137A|nr:tetratricopeptide repeat protein [Arenimonas daejeonensis]